MDNPSTDDAVGAPPAVSEGHGRVWASPRTLCSALALLGLMAAVVAFDGKGLRPPGIPELTVRWGKPLLGFLPLGLLGALSLFFLLRSPQARPVGRVGIVACGLLLLLGLVASKGLCLYPPPGAIPWAEPRQLFPVLLVLLPVAITSSLSFSLVALLILGALMGFADPSSNLWRWDLTVVTLGGGLPAVLIAAVAHGRGALLLSGVIGGAGLTLAWLGVFVVEAGWDPLSSAAAPAGLLRAAVGIPNGLCSGALVALGLPVIERVLRRTSNVSLAGLLRLDHPLLLWIHENAPGTYHHSLNVGMLAAMAARGVRANPLLAQAGGHFHDLGKVKRAGYFMENIRGSNPHDEMPPGESAEIILAHASDGFEIARKRRLPPEVAAIAREHQGTTVVEWFYSKAQKEGGEVTEEDFRYSGPKPQGREAALVMLADSVEAVSRTLEDPDEEAFQKAVDHILQKKEGEGQLEESGLRRGHLPQIRRAFLQGLQDIHHRRISYPGGASRPTGPSDTPRQGLPATPPGETSR